MSDPAPGILSVLHGETVTDGSLLWLSVGWDPEAQGRCDNGLWVRMR